jgi:hypothetical protein
MTIGLQLPWSDADRDPDKAFAASPGGSVR